MPYERCSECGALVTCVECGLIRSACADVGQRLAGKHAYTTRRDLDTARRKAEARRVALLSAPEVKGRRGKP